MEVYNKEKHKLYRIMTFQKDALNAMNVRFIMRK